MNASNEPTQEEATAEEIKQLQDRLANAGVEIASLKTELEMTRKRLQTELGEAKRVAHRAQEKLIRVNAIIAKYGAADGAHHKQWALDQIIRILTGDGYEDWVRAYEFGKDGPETYKWHTGCRP